MKYKENEKIEMLFMLHDNVIKMISEFENDKIKFWKAMRQAKKNLVELQELFGIKTKKYKK